MSACSSGSTKVIHLLLMMQLMRGLIELRKLAIEAQLWQASRKLVDPDSEHKWQMHINF
ncbi:hypothetical protein HanHA300_Chr12g0456951 [Helianthus annuus]|nr:hypothetical protein HanHA300_Chr12g0456951 [Helianthus annuus]KAJ0506485.1 hypothetical protein HanHA89_Chr12g0482531 [Helianthus annuus]KAJ0676163.1 hypothetical protein HanLR1_Chr12g0459541 [Helianthus annuus]